MKFAEHIKLLKEVKARLPMTEERINYYGDDIQTCRSEFICDNLSGTYGVRGYGDPIADEIKDFIHLKINGAFSLLEYHDFSGTFEGGQQLRQEFLDVLILYYENLNEQS